MPTPTMTLPQINISINGFAAPSISVPLPRCAELVYHLMQWNAMTTPAAFTNEDDEALLAQLRSCAEINLCRAEVVDWLNSKHRC
jgi:hypothetical protein